MKSHFVDVGGRLLRVARSGPGSSRVPLLICNGLGVSLDLLGPFMAELEGMDVIAFDPPGIGGSPPARLPYRLPALVRLIAEALTRLDVGTVDVLGVSWGGLLAQQFARDCEHRCRRLVLAATSTGAVSFPGSWRAMTALLSARSLRDVEHFQRVAGETLGGDFRHDPGLVRRLVPATYLSRGRGFQHQLLAAAGWTSVHWLWRLRQPALVLAGTDDPLAPTANAALMTWLLRDARRVDFDCGHLFLLTRACAAADVVRRFLGDQPGP